MAEAPLVEPGQGMEQLEGKPALFGAGREGPRADAVVQAREDVGPRKDRVGRGERDARVGQGARSRPSTTTSTAWGAGSKAWHGRALRAPGHAPSTREVPYYL